MKARYIILIYMGNYFKNPGRVERICYDDNPTSAYRRARQIQEFTGKHVEAWDIITDKIVWER